jgi:hypothetical protein
VRISHLDNNDAVDVIASRLRHLHYLRQVVLRATLAALIEMPLQEPRGSALQNMGGFIVLA